MSSVREVISTSAHIDPWDRSNPFAEGTFRFACHGKFTNGPRCHQAAVFKYFKSGSVYESDFFRLDINAQEKAIDIVSEFNQYKNFGKPIQVSRAQVFTNGENGEKFLVEPFIRDWQKFNSNSGWVGDFGHHSWGAVMQALSHFSYHKTGGFYLLCDIQGGIYKDKIVISDPVIMSRDRRFGVTDLGLEGMENFFARHQCNDFCSRSWQIPKFCRQWMDAQKGTTMLEMPKPVPKRGPGNSYMEMYDDNGDDDYYN